MFPPRTSPLTLLVRQLTTATRPYLAVTFAAQVNVEASVVALIVATLAPVAATDAVQDEFNAQDESVNTFMIPRVLSLLKKVRNNLMATYATNREVLRYYDMKCSLAFHGLYLTRILFLDLYDIE